MGQIAKQVAKWLAIEVLSLGPLQLLVYTVLAILLFIAFTVTPGIVVAATVIYVGMTVGLKVADEAASKKQYQKLVSTLAIIVPVLMTAISVIVSQKGFLDVAGVAAGAAVGTAGMQNTARGMRKKVKKKRRKSDC